MAGENSQECARYAGDVFEFELVFVFLCVFVFFFTNWPGRAVKSVPGTMAMYFYLNLYLYLYVYL